jgi:hypothetical protein
MSNTATRTQMYLPGAAADEFPPNFAEFAAARAKGIATAQAISADAESGVNLERALMLEANQTPGGVWPGSL